MILLFLLFLIICSFVLFVTSRHDFALLRQNISIRFVFDKALIVVLFALIFARVGYLLDEKMYEFFLDPLSFLHVIIYYGFNLLSLVVAIAVGIVLFYRKRKNVLRILDIYLLSFFPLTVFEAISLLIYSELDILFSIGYLIVSLLLFLTFIKMHISYKIKDGTVSFLALSFISLSYMGYSFLDKDFLIYSPIQILAMLTLAISVYCLVLIQTNFFKDK